MNDLKQILPIKRMQEADLNNEAAKAGAYYDKKVCEGMPMVERQMAVNHCARGFAMGVRWLEQKLGVKE